MKRDQEVFGGTDLRKREELIRAISATLLSSVLLLGCSKAQHAVGPAPDVRVTLSRHGLPADFYRLSAEQSVLARSSDVRHGWETSENDAVVALGKAAGIPSSLSTRVPFRSLAH
jgi:hypothetical protein